LHDIFKKICFADDVWEDGQQGPPYLPASKFRFDYKDCLYSFNMLFLFCKFPLTIKLIIASTKKPSYHRKSGNPARLKAPWLSVPILRWVWLYLYAILTNFYDDNSYL